MGKRRSDRKLQFLLFRPFYVGSPLARPTLPKSDYGTNSTGLSGEARGGVVVGGVVRGHTLNTSQLVRGPRTKRKRQSLDPDGRFLGGVEQR